MDNITINAEGESIEIPLRPLPQNFVHWQCSARIRSLERMLEGVGPGGFGPHLPVMSTRGSYHPFPVSSAAKGVGLLPREDLLEEKTSAFEKMIKEGIAGDWEETFPERFKALMEFYSREDELDIYKLGSLEIYGKRTYENIQQDPRASLLYVDLESGVLSYMVNCVTEIVKPGSPYYRFEMAAHDMFHKPSDRKVPAAYVFYVSEVYDKSPGKRAGVRVV